MSEPGARPPLSLVVGATGQDGTYLCRDLARRGQSVVGLGRDRAWHDETPIPPVDLGDTAALGALVRALRPDTIYHLAAHHASSEAPAEETAQAVRRALTVNLDSLISLLDAVARFSPRSRLFYAASSRVFGAPSQTPQTEATPRAPLCPYGLSKAAGLDLCRVMRAQGVFASAGILYNHESPLRPPTFVTRRVVRAAVAIERRLAPPLIEVGDLSAVVDWGWAPDFVDAFQRILSLPEPDTFVVATGVGRRVADLVDEVLRAAGLDGAVEVRETPGRVRPALVSVPLIGDYAKLHQATGWRPTCPFPEMIRRMLEEERRHAF